MWQNRLPTTFSISRIINCCLWKKPVYDADCYPKRRSLSHQGTKTTLQSLYILYGNRCAVSCKIGRMPVLLLTYVSCLEFLPHCPPMTTCHLFFTPVRLSRICLRLQLEFGAKIHACQKLLSVFFGVTYTFSKFFSKPSLCLASTHH